MFPADIWEYPIPKVGNFSFRFLGKTLDEIQLPKRAVNDRLVGVLKHKAFLIGGKAAFIGLKIRSDGLSQHSMTEIFLSA